MSPRLASAMTMRPAADASAISRSSSAIPVAPCRLKKATWGLTTLTAPANPSTHEVQKERRPLASSLSPHAASNAADGSIPAHSGPVLATAAATRSPKLSAITSSFVEQFYGRACPAAVDASVGGGRAAPAPDAAPDPLADLAHRGGMGVTPAGELAEPLPRRPGGPEGRGAHLDGLGAGQQQLHGVKAREHTADADDRQLGEGRPALPYRPHGDGMHGAPGQPAPAGAEDGPARLGVEGQAEQRVHQ